MLTRLKVSGFKNLVDVDLRFGPFTCISGGNGTGKSNLFDAISFLGALSDSSFIEAARSVRNEGGRATDIHGLFHRCGEYLADEMTFEAEMIVPDRGVDDLGQEVRAKITFLRYRVTLGLRRGNLAGFDSLELIKEELSHINLGTASQHILFPHKITAWRHSAVKGRRSGGAFISTQGEGKGRIVELHTDGEGGGRPRMILAEGLPRTILSTVNTAEYPTALMARREMQSWRKLRLEPSALRRPDELTAGARLGTDGSHLAATLYHLHKTEEHARGNFADNGPAPKTGGSGIYERLAGLLGCFGIDVREVKVEHDEKREVLSLVLTGGDGTPFSTRDLSDGVLRFLALAAISLDTHTPVLICLEEAENGICPDRIPALLKLLQDTVVDVNRPVGPDNPLRQVIITTHSPVVISLVEDESLLVTEVFETTGNDRAILSSRFSCLSGTWRHKPDENAFAIDREKIASCPCPGEKNLTETQNEEPRKRSSKSPPQEDQACQQIQPSLPYGE